MNNKYVSFGEIMLRLKSPGFDRLFQSPTLEAIFGGEANVAVSLANYGFDTAFVTALPDNDVGKSCFREIRSRICGWRILPQAHNQRRLQPVTADEVKKLIGGDGTGRIAR